MTTPRRWVRRGVAVGEVPVVVGKVPVSVNDLADGGAGGGLVDEVLAGGEGGDQGLQGQVVDRAGVAAAGGVDQVQGVFGEEMVGAAGEVEVVADVAGGLGRGHGRHGEAQGGALFQGGQDGEFHGAAQGGLPDEQAGQGGVLVHRGVGEHADGFQLLVGEQVSFVQDQDGGAAAFFAFGHEGLAGLGEQPGSQVGGGLAEGGEDLFADAADPDHRVGQVDDGVPGGIQAGQDGADRDGLAGSDLAGDDADRAFADAPGDAGDGLVVGGVPVQHPGCEVPAEGHAAEPVVGLQFLNQRTSPGGWSWPPAAGSAALPVAGGSGARAE